ncbi:MAG: toll/interleukin-1 receptor domain-containing protein [Lachnospiraceae bacterium]|nr:toll/interleukin-1 receptor domain-containing protein [Lachnospiraceae bacterium]
MSEEVRYNAFISYRHCEPDKTIAKALHRKLENYHIPKELRSKLGRNVLGRVFRDEAELPVTDSLSDAILEALRCTEYLIVICSPRLKESAWCMKEIEIFTRLHGKKKILPVLIEGEPEDSFPESLFYEDIIEKDPDGNEVTVRIDKEPLAADCRGGRKAMRDTVIKLSAAMLGLNYDDLKQRHRVERLKRRTIFSGVIFAAVLVFLFQSLYFLNTIRRQKKEIEAKYAYSMANTSVELLKSGDRMAALYAARSVLPDKRNDEVSPDAFRALVDATHMYSRDVYVTERRVADSFVYGIYVFSPSGSKVVIDEGERCTLVDTLTGNTEYSFKADMGSVGFYRDEALAYSLDGKVYYYDIEKRTSDVILDTDAKIFSTPSGEALWMISDDAIRCFKGREEVFGIDAKDLGIKITEAGEKICYFSEDERFCLVNIKNFNDDGNVEEDLIQISAETGKVIAVLDGLFESGQFGENAYLEDMDTDGSRIYLLVNEMFGDSDRILYCYDIKKNKVIMATDLGREAFTDLYYIDHRLVLLSGDRVMIYDEGLDYVNSFGVPNYPMEVLYVEGIPVVRNGYGELYSLEEEKLGFEMTEDLFEDWQQRDVDSFKWIEDRIYVKFSSQEGIVVYAKAGGEAYVPMQTQADMSALWAESVDYDTVKGFFEDIDEVDGDSFLSGACSTDGRYYVGILSDRSAVIYNAETKQRVAVLYDVVPYVNRFLYSEKYGCYVIISDRMDVFDSDFGHMLSIDGIWEVAEEDGKIFVCINGGDICELKLLSYEETIEYADALLEGYTPSQRQCDKYGF